VLVLLLRVMAQQEPLPQGQLGEQRVPPQAAGPQLMPC
jgi:hypothetical protein